MWCACSAHDFYTFYAKINQVHTPNGTPSVPRDRSGRLPGEVVGDTVNALDLVDDAGGDAVEEGGLEPSWCRRRPRIEQPHAGPGEVGLVAGDQDQAVDEGGGGDQRVTVGAVEAGASAGHVEVHGQHPVPEAGKDRVLQPVPQQRTLGGIAALDAQDADLQLQEHYRRQPEQGGRGPVGPSTHGGVGAGAAAQLRHEIGV